MNEINTKLERAYKIANQENDYDAAIAICNEVIAEDPSSPEGLNARARIHELSGNLEDAVEDITHVIQIDPNEPDYYFNRGRWHLGLGNLSEAVADETKAIDLGVEKDFHYYDECAYFFRAAAYLRLRRYEEALSDCERVEDDFIMYSTGLGKLTKENLVREVERFFQK
jgi:tetratricopeptide (TPR) repeat protein